MSGRVIVVGSVNVDLVVAVERLPAPGETVIGGAVRAPSTAARAATRRSRRPGSVRRRVVRRRGRRRRHSAHEARAALEAQGVDVGGLVGSTDDADRRRADPRRRGGRELRSPSRRGANARARRRPGPGRAQAPRRCGRSDVVLVGHEIRTGATHEALRLGRSARRDDDLQPGPGGRARPHDPRARGRPDPEPRRAGRAGRAAMAAHRRGPSGCSGANPGAGRVLVVRSVSRGALLVAGRAARPSMRRGSRRSTRSAPATPSTAPSPRAWPPGWTSRRPRGGRSSRPRSRSRAPAPARACRRATSWSAALAG